MFVEDDGGIGSENIDPGLIAEGLSQHSVSNNGTVECVVLNACSTEEMRRMLRSKSIKHVVCWRGEERDGAIVFSQEFHASLQHGNGQHC